MNWIKVENQMPEIETSVLVCYETNNAWSKEKQKYIKVKKVSVGYLANLTRFADPFWNVHGELDAKVVAWAPLPDPI